MASTGLISYRTHRAARTTLQRAVVFSCAVHFTVVAGIALSSVLSGSRHRLTDISSETALQFSLSPPAPPPDPTPPDDPPPATPAPAEPPPMPQPEAPVEQPKEAPRDDAFGKVVAELPPVTPGVVPTPDSTPAPNPSQWVDAPAPPPPPQDPKASFAGVEATPARRIVYLIDGSGPMAASLTFIKSELASSVARLNSDQNFQVIVYRQPTGGRGEPLSYFFRDSTGQPDLTPANLSAKGNVRDWLDSVSPVGRSEPLMGIEAALRLQPDIIFVLARSIARSGGVDVQSRNQQILDTLERINPRQPLGGRLSRIKTIQFLEDDPTGLMQAIAREHGDGDGSYRLVTRAEVGKTKPN